jgi:hypothetical protein
MSLIQSGLHVHREKMNGTTHLEGKENVHYIGFKIKSGVQYARTKHPESHR